jgi:Malectin domain
MAPAQVMMPTPVASPIKALTNDPILALTNVPVKPPTKAPVKSLTKTPTKSPTKTPTKRPTKAPTKSPTKAPIKAPTKAPIKASTASPKAPAWSPTVLIDCGSSSSYTDSQNRLWLADQYFDAQSGVFNTNSTIADTVEDTLYQTERTGVTVGYNIPRPPGTYAVTLHFAEI